MKISVVIPSHNRENELKRAINSIINQDVNHLLEIVIIDDASIDNTEYMVKSLRRTTDIPIYYKKNITSMGGAIARNQGSEIATGDIIAFLDSDDEWLSNHLAINLDLLARNNAKGIFSNFVVSNGEKNELFEFKEKESNFFMGDYILSGIGDTRTSTFVLKKDYFDQIKFDTELQKHQDWDFAIRFDEMFEMRLNKEPTVIIHKNVKNRMSNNNNHPASKYFIDKYKKKLNSNSKTNFYTNLAINTLRYEGKNIFFDKYIDEAEKACPKNDVKKHLKIKLLKLPFINVIKIYDYFKGS